MIQLLFAKKFKEFETALVEMFMIKVFDRVLIIPISHYLRIVWKVSLHFLITENFVLK